jgi:hypothetical protein
VEPKDDMEDKDRPGDDALQEEQQPCRQADHGSQTFSSCTQSHRMFLNLDFCIFFLALCSCNVLAFKALRAMIALAVGHPKWEPFCNHTAGLLLTAAFCHNFIRLVKIQISELL